MMLAIRVHQEKTVKALRGRVDVLNKEGNIHAGATRGFIKKQPADL